MLSQLSVGHSASECPDFYPGVQAFLLAVGSLTIGFLRGKRVSSHVDPKGYV